jgi:hypothetical protein
MTRAGRCNVAERICHANFRKKRNDINLADAALVKCLPSWLILAIGALIFRNLLFRLSTYDDKKRNLY